MRLRARARGPNENERRAVKARSRRDCAHPSRPQERRENEREKQSHADCTTRIYTRSLAGCTPEISPERGVSFFFLFMWILFSCAGIRERFRCGLGLGDRAVWVLINFLVRRSISLKKISYYLERTIAWNKPLSKEYIFRALNYDYPLRHAI